MESLTTMATMTVQTEYSALNMISNFPNSCIFRLRITDFVLQHFKVKSLKKPWQQFRRDFALLKIVSACQKPVRPSPPSTTTVPPLLCYMWERREWRTYRTYYDPRTSSWCSFFAPLLCSTWKRSVWRTSRTYYDPRTSSWCSILWCWFPVTIWEVVSAHWGLIMSDATNVMQDFSSWRYSSSTVAETII